MPQFILASGSPRRREILSDLGLDYTVIKSDVDECSDITDPGALTEELAKRKGQAVADILGDTKDKVIISCDTVVFSDGEILGKPCDEADAKRMLEKLSGRTHSVVSGISLICGGKTVTAHEVSYVTFANMTDGEINACVKLGEPLDKAGAYAIQGTAALFIKGLDGDYFNVVGLPVFLLRKTLLDGFGIRLEDYLH